MSDFETSAMAQFFKENFPGTFQPCAYYDKHLDCIRVQIKDCSFTEIRLNKIFTIYQANHTDNVEYIGFSIKGIRYVFEKMNLPMKKDGPYLLAEILDAIIKENPENFSDLIQREFSNRLDLPVEGFDYQEAA